MDPEKTTENKEQLKEQIRYVSPTRREYRDYFDHIISFNRAVQEGTIAELKEFFGILEGGVITTSGSDARLEKGPQSLLEIVLLSEDDTASEELVEKTTEFMRWSRRTYDERVEVKIVGKDRMSESFFQKEGKPIFSFISPNRMFDARYLIGDEELYVRAEEQFVEELRESGYGRKIKEKVRDGVRNHKKVCSTGKQRFKGKTLVHFSLEESMARYDPEAHVWSFKQGPLRLVQYAIVRDLINIVRSQESAEDIMGLPHSTVNKINYLNVRGRLAISEEDARILADHYKNFLWLYHRSQEAYAGGIKDTVFDAVEVRERLDDVVRLCSNPLIR